MAQVPHVSQGRGVHQLQTWRRLKEMVRLREKVGVWGGWLERARVAEVYHRSCGLLSDIQGAPLQMSSSAQEQTSHLLDLLSESQKKNKA